MNNAEPNTHNNNTNDPNLPTFDGGTHYDNGDGGYASGTNYASDPGVENGSDDLAHDPGIGVHYEGTNKVQYAENQPETEVPSQYVTRWTSRATLNAAGKTALANLEQKAKQLETSEDRDQTHALRERMLNYRSETPSSNTWRAANTRFRQN